MAEDASREIISRLILVSKPTVRDVNLIKMQVAQAHNLQTLPPNSMLIRNLKHGEKRLLSVLCQKRVRTMMDVLQNYRTL